MKYQSGTIAFEESKELIIKFGLLLFCIILQNIIACSINISVTVIFIIMIVITIIIVIIIGKYYCY